ncbi:MAG: helix-turn-helix domain-containing protein, partial [Thermodesulfobacteriota bacterium]|nr:helix-turn-helix domain-containing protein [Thermodesulfobacteriota bacterium]
FLPLIHKDEDKDMALEEVEARHINKILRKTNGSRTEAAAILGIDRRTLYRKIKKYKLAFE